MGAIFQTAKKNTNLAAAQKPGAAAQKKTGKKATEATPASDPDRSNPSMAEVKYTEDEVRTLDWREHIRLRPGMYIGKLGDGSSPDDGIYVLLKEVLDNCIDEFAMGFGKHIDIALNEQGVSVRDFGRGIPLGKVVDVVSKINTGAKYDF